MGGADADPGPGILGQPLPQAIDAARTQLADGTQSTRLDALQSELDTLKGSLGNSGLNLDQLLYAFKQTLPQARGRCRQAAQCQRVSGSGTMKNGNLAVAVFSGSSPGCHARTVKEAGSAWRRPARSARAPAGHWPLPGDPPPPCSDPA